MRWHILSFHGSVLPLIRHFGELPDGINIFGEKGKNPKSQTFAMAKSWQGVREPFEISSLV
jgi:hypothetical protein